jgi:hypothetical protein
MGKEAHLGYDAYLIREIARFVADAYHDRCTGNFVIGGSLIARTSAREIRTPKAHNRESWPGRDLFTLLSLSLSLAHSLKAG